MKKEPLPKLFPNRPWQSSGISSKPDHCQKNCPFGNNSKSGFVLDYYGKDPKIGFMQSAPQNSDLISQVPWSGSWGWKWTKELLETHGLTRDNVVLMNVLRCGFKDYPTGAAKIRAEKTCRYWDAFHNVNGLPFSGGILHYNPNLYVITYDPTDWPKVGAYMQQTKLDVAKALRFADRGYRPLVLMGIEAVKLVAPWLGPGGIKAWRGHWWEGDYNIELPEVVESRRSFIKDKLERKKK